MKIEVELDEFEIAAIQRLLMKLTYGGLSQPFTPEERELMERMRANRESVLVHLNVTLSEFKGANEAGLKKMENLRKMVEKICGV
jgi:hypothetical protein